MWWTMNNMWYLGIANVDIREIPVVPHKAVAEVSE